MIIRIFFVFLVLSFALPVAAGQASAEQAPPADVVQAVQKPNTQSEMTAEEFQTLIERRRSELEGKLRVDQVLLNGTSEKGVEIEISYRIVGVEGYAAHPKTTFIADEASNTLIPLTILHKLFKPLPVEEAEKMPPATLILRDKAGVIKPGLPVTVVVAGYVQKHLIPVAGPDYDPQALVTTKPGERNPPAEADAKLTVHTIRTVAEGHMLKVSYSSEGITKLDTAGDQTYIENPETGEKHPVVKVPSIGVPASKDIEGMAVSYLLIDNAGEKIKPGQQVNIVVSGVRAERITVVNEARK